MPDDRVDDERALKDILAEGLRQIRRDSQRCDDAAKKWRDDVFAPFQDEMRAAIVELRKVDVDLKRTAADAVLKAAAVEQAAKGSEEAVLSELVHVKGKVAEVADALSAAKALTGEIPLLRAQLAAAQGQMTKAGENVTSDAAARRRWRKIQPPLTALIVAVILSLSQRFVLPPAAQNDPRTMLPGPTPTVVALPPPR